MKKSNEKTKLDKYQFFYQRQKSQTPTGNTGTSWLPSLSDCSMYKEKSSIKFVPGVFISFDQTDIIQVSVITFL